jgi:hypothetical protein
MSERDYRGKKEPVIKQKRSRALWAQYARLWPDTLTPAEREQLELFEREKKEPPSK